MATRSPGLAVKIAVGRPKPGSDLGAPPGIGGAPEPDSDEQGGAPDQDQDDQGDGVTLQDMGFHDGTETCAVCKYFDQQNGECMKATSGDTTVDKPESSWCHAFQPQEGGGGEEPVGVGAAPMGGAIGGR